MKVIFLCNQKLNSSFYYTLYVETIKRYFETEIWDLSWWLSNNNCIVRNQILEKNTVAIHNGKEFEDSIACVNQEGLVIFLTATDMSGFAEIGFFLKKYNAKVACIDKEHIGCEIQQKSCFDYRRMLPFKRKVITYMKQSVAIRKLLHFIRYKNIKFDYALLPRNVFPETNKTFIPFHYPECSEDYLYSFYDRKKEIENKGYAVFIDTAAAVHPGIANVGLKVDAESYFEITNRYLDRFEEKNQIEVIVAAYPKLTYEKGTFGHRKIVYGETQKLINSASVVLAHSSSSLVYAILLKKPIVFLYYNEMLRDEALSQFAIGAMERAKLLGQPCDEMKNDCTTEFTVDESKYISFAEEWIIAKSKKDMSNEEIIIDFLKKYEKGKI